MADYEMMVREFMVKHGQFAKNLPSTNLPAEVKLLRLRLMAEELGEVASAIHQDDIVEIADGLADLIYVAVGTAIAFGIPINEVFTEVHRSNMTKAPLNKHSKGGKVEKGSFEKPDILRVFKEYVDHFHAKMVSGEPPLPFGTPDEKHTKE